MVGESRRTGNSLQEEIERDMHRWEITVKYYNQKRHEHVNREGVKGRIG